MQNVPGPLLASPFQDRMLRPLRYTLITISPADPAQQILPGQKRMPDAEPDEQDLPPVDQTPGTLSNIKRLRAQLVSGSLAAALLAAWEDGDAQHAQMRMLDAVHSFNLHGPEQDGDDQTPAQ
jgi:hypothetical protein